MLPDEKVIPLVQTDSIAEEVAPYNYLETPYKAASMQHGFIKLQRAAEELFYTDQDCFLLLTQMAFRALREDSRFNKHKLKPNQCFIGDYKAIGLSEQRYRDAKKRIEQKYKIATFKGTNKGTIGTFLDTSVYDINSGLDNGQENSPTTDKQRLTKKKEERKESKAKVSPPSSPATSSEKAGAFSPPPPPSSGYEEMRSLGVSIEDCINLPYQFEELHLKTAKAELKLFIDSGQSLTISPGDFIREIAGKLSSLMVSSCNEKRDGEQDDQFNNTTE